MSAPQLLIFEIADTAILKLASLEVIRRYAPAIQSSHFLDNIDPDELEKHIRVSADLSLFMNFIKRKDLMAFKDKAKRFLIQRGAHSSMLYELFGMVKHEITKLRRELKVEMATAHRSHLSDKELEMIYSHWKRISKAATDVVDAWCQMGLEPDLLKYTMSTLYKTVKGDS
jgi:Protein of unknown function (DUF2857)